MWIIGLTGAIGAGKSRVSAFFRHLGVPVHCADGYIHHLFKEDHDVQGQIKSLWPEAFVGGTIDRSVLGNRVLTSPPDLQKLEEILYPKLAEDQKRFLKKNQYLKKPVVVLDVPLLFEVGLDSYCDSVVLVSSPFSLRHQRVMGRKEMTTRKFLAFESLQMKDSERKRKANFIIYTGRDKGNALRLIKKFLFVLSVCPPQKWKGNWPRNLKRIPHESRNRFRHRNNRI